MHREGGFLNECVVETEGTCAPMLKSGGFGAFSETIEPETESIDIDKMNLLENHARQCEIIAEFDRHHNNLVQDIINQMGDTGQRFPAIKFNW